LFHIIITAVYVVPMATLGWWYINYGQPMCVVKINILLVLDW